MNDKQLAANGVPRRSLLTNCLAAIFGLAAIGAPTAAGLTVLTDPLRKRTQTTGNWLRVATLSQVPADGKPHPFPVVEAEPRDKWNLYEPQSVGGVFLVRSEGSEQVTALSSICPHLGCAVTYNTKADSIICPCHNAVFDCNGRQSDTSTVSPRDLDSLQARVDEKGDVLVNYKRFKGGIAEREEV